VKICFGAGRQYLIHVLFYQADITCDSDGVLNHFISTRDAVDFDPILPLHELRGAEPYHLAMFLTGAQVTDPPLFSSQSRLLCRLLWPAGKSCIPLVVQL